MITTGENLKGVSGIYCAIHRDSGMCYVGSSVNVARRLNNHSNDARKGVNNAFYRAIRTFGESAFDFEVLERCERNALLEREGFYIALFNSASSDGFNTYTRPLAYYGIEKSLATRQRISDAIKGRKLSPESLARRKGKKHSTESNIKRSLALKGRGLSAEHRAKISIAASKRKHTEATREKLRTYQNSPAAQARLRAYHPSPTTLANQSARLKGRIISQEQREKIRAKLLGGSLSKEHKENIRLGMLKHFQNKQNTK